MDVDHDVNLHASQRKTKQKLRPEIKAAAQGAAAKNPVILSSIKRFRL